MRRLAAVTVGAVLVIGIGPATAGLGDDRPDESWCDHHAAAAGFVAGSYFEVVVGAGTTRDRPVYSGFACADGHVGRRQFDALVTAWLDTEDGNAGVACPHQAAPDAVTCKQRTVPLPGRSANRADAAQNRWTVDVLGAGIAYDVGDGVSVEGRTPATCLREACVADRAPHAWVEPGDQSDPVPDAGVGTRQGSGGTD